MRYFTTGGIRIFMCSKVAILQTIRIATLSYDNNMFITENIYSVYIVTKC